MTTTLDHDLDDAATATHARPIIHFVDDDAMFRSALAEVLELAGYDVRQYESAGAFLLSGPPRGPGCVLLDLRMPGPSGLELQEALARNADGMPIVFLTGYGDVPTTARAMKRGALDVLTKPVDRDTLLAAVHAAHERDAQWRRERARHATIEARFASLTPREQAILDGVVAGRLNKQIAGDLHIAERTVKTHRAQLMAKLGAASAADLALIADERARMSSRAM
jgi:FixJ family two-component response regulator